MAIHTFSFMSKISGRCYIFHSLSPLNIMLDVQIYINYYIALVVVAYGMGAIAPLGNKAVSHFGAEFPKLSSHQVPFFKIVYIFISFILFLYILSLSHGPITVSNALCLELKFL